MRCTPEQPAVKDGGFENSKKTGWSHVFVTVPSERTLRSVFFKSIKPKRTGEEVIAIMQMAVANPSPAPRSSQRQLPDHGLPHKSPSSRSPCPLSPSKQTGDYPLPSAWHLKGYSFPRFIFRKELAWGTADTLQELKEGNHTEIEIKEGS